MSPLSALAVGLLQGYQRLFSPLLPPVCRFFPSCSEYAKEVIQEYGFFRGSWFAVRRLCRCQPFSPGGFDPPPRVSTTAESGGRVRP